MSLVQRLRCVLIMLCLWALSAAAQIALADPQVLFDHIGSPTATTDTSGFASFSDTSTSFYATSAAHFIPSASGDLSSVSAVIWGPSNWTGVTFAVDLWDFNPGTVGNAAAQTGNRMHQTFAAPTGGSLVTPWSTYFGANNYRVDFAISPTHVDQGAEYWIALRTSLSFSVSGEMGVVVSIVEGDGFADPWASSKLGLVCQSAGNVSQWNTLPQLLFGGQKKFAYAVSFVPCGASISSQPQNASVATGRTASFSVVPSGAPSASYQWRRNGVALGNGGHVSGATTSELTIQPVAFADAGTYDVVVASNCGPIVSNPATLSVHGSGDVNVDGLVNTADVAGFTLALLDSSGFATGCPGCVFENADTNGDLSVDGTDIQRFVTCVTASVCP